LDVELQDARGTVRTVTNNARCTHVTFHLLGPPLIRHWAVWRHCDVISVL